MAQVPLYTNAPAETTSTPLQREWTVWFDKRPAPGRRRGEAETYESNLTPIGSFGTVEAFWQLYSNLRRPSDIENNANYHVFETGIKPMWEDPENINGGKWVVNVKSNRAALDSYWENLLLALIGETVDPDDEICGIVLSRRKHGDRIAIWNRSKNDRKVIMTLGRRLQEALTDGLLTHGEDLGEVGEDGQNLVPLPVVSLEYQHHEDSLRTGASYTTQTRICL